MESKQGFPISIEQDEDKMFIVSCPTFKGCHADGKTLEEALNNIEQVIEMCIEEKLIKE
jgi:predicted RNase H-like HicB family nuclease